jgi:WD40 repeat protein
MAQQLSTSNPFPGLRSFESDENHLFFGRETQIRESIERLTQKRFLAIIGSSGSGKSSLVRAGIIPSLFKQLHHSISGEWNVMIFRPGENPIERLTTTLVETFKLVPSGQNFESQCKQIVTELHKNPSTLVEIIKKSAGSKNTLIVIDQFEEIFRFKQESEANEDSYHETNQFVNLFLEALNQQQVPIYIALTMRADFLSDCAEFLGLTEALNEGHYLVPRMTIEERKTAITAPILLCGGAISERLVERLIDDTGNDPDQLPILQHALMRTWDFWQTTRLDDQPIDIAHYEAIGTMKEALSRHAEEVYNELPDTHAHQITEKLFKSLTNLGEDSRGTRRPTSLAEICRITDSKEEQVINIIESFRQSGRSFLMPPVTIDLFPETMIDISHESLMRVWTRLRSWVEEETKSAELYLRLSKSAELYQDGRAGLLVNPELQLAMKWKTDTKPNSTWANRYNPAFERSILFLEHSNKEFNLEIARRESQQKRELKRAKMFAVILGSASVVSLLFLMVAMNLKFKAEESERIALEQQKIAFSQSSEAQKQRKEAIAQKHISDQQQQIAEQQQRLAERERAFAVQQQGIAVRQTQIAVEQKQEAVSQKQKADEAKIAAIKARDEAENQRKEALNQKKNAEEQRTKAEISERNAQRLRYISTARSLAIQASVVYKSDRSELPALIALQAYNFNKASNGSPKDPDIYKALSEVADDKIVFSGHTGEVRSVAVSPDGQWILSGSNDGTVRIWNTLPKNGPQPLSTVLKFSKIGRKISRPTASSDGRSSTSGIFDKAVRTVDFSPDGKYAAAGFFDGTIRVWDMNNRVAEPIVFIGHTDVVSEITFMPDSKKLASASADGSVRLWNIEQNNSDQTPMSLLLSVKLTSLAHSPDGHLLAFGCEDGTVQIINMNKLGELPMVIRTGEKAIEAVGFSPDGITLATGGRSGKLQLWNVKKVDTKPTELLGHISGITRIRFSPDGGTIATSSLDKSIRLWNYRKLEEQPIVIQSGHDKWIYSLVFNSDGTKLITGSADNSIKIWTTRADILADKICKTAKRNMTTEEWNKYVGTDITYEETCKQK